MDGPPTPTPNGPSPGLEGVVEATVEESMTAERVGSGDVPVLATPALLSLVERAAVRALMGHLPAGGTSLGASVDLAHLAATPVGGSVRAVARVEAVEERRVTFSFSVDDAAGQVASGTHVRVVVDRERFVRSAAARATRGTTNAS